MADNKLVRKILVYGTEYGARLIGNALDTSFKYTPLLHSDRTDKIGYKLGHPFTAMGFAAWDIVFESIPGLKKNDIANTLNKAVKLGGLAYFGFLTGKNMVDFALGNYTEAGQFPFNVLMTASLGMDVKESFS